MRYDVKIVTEFTSMNDDPREETVHHKNLSRAEVIEMGLDPNSSKTQELPSSNPCGVVEHRITAWVTRA